MHGSGRNDAGKMFIGGLSWDTTKDSMLSYFGQYGEVVDCIVMKNPETGKSRGFGFVTYKDSSCVEAVLSVPGHIVDGRQVDPKACSPKGPGAQQAGRQGMNRDDGGGRRVGGGLGRGRGSRKIFIGGLPSNVDEEFLKNFFGKYGTVQEIAIMYDAQRQRSRGFGFLTFEDDEALEKVCGEHFIIINGKKVECKRAEPRTNKDPSEPPSQAAFQPQQQMAHMQPPLEIQQPPQQQAQPEGNWAPPPSESPAWNQGPPAPLQMVSAQFPPSSGPNGAQFPGYQEPSAGGMQSWPPQGQQPPQQQPPNNGSGWPPQQGPPGSSQYVGQPPASQQYSVQQVQQQPAPGYQWAASPPAPTQHPSAANGQAPAPAPVPVPYGYQSPPGGAVRSAAPAGMAPKPYGDFPSQAPDNPQQQFQPAPVPVPSQSALPAPVVSATQGYAYPSPYGAPAQVTGAAVDPYGQPVAAPTQTTAVPVPVAQSAHPGAVQGAYGSPVAAAPVAAPTDPTQPKPAEYAAYNPYGAYGAAVSQYTAEPGYSAGVSSPTHLSAVPGGFPQGGATLTSPASATAPSALTGYGAESTAVAAYGAAPVGTQPPYGGQGDAQSLAAYGGAPGQAQSFQRQTGAQAYHPYRR